MINTEWKKEEDDCVMDLVNEQVYFSGENYINLYFSFIILHKYGIIILNYSLTFYFLVQCVSVDFYDAHFRHLICFSITFSVFTNLLLCHLQFFFFLKWKCQNHQIFVKQRFFFVRKDSIIVSSQGLWEYKLTLL